MKLATARRRLGERATLLPDVAGWDDLVEVYPTLSLDSRLTALKALEHGPDDVAVPFLLGLMEQADDHAWEAALVLERFQDDRSHQGLADLLEHHDSSWVRQAAAYALGFRRDPRAQEPLIRVVLNRQEADNVRGQAAEGLAYLGQFVDPKKKLVWGSIPPLLAVLDDPSATVRFWACFALGQLAERRAGRARVRGYRDLMAALQRVAREDHTVLPNWWSVGEEAADALAFIEGRPTVHMGRNMA
ncbi:MAG: HEAT repeat domain-containing protein [Candidatus Xenobia bacterium]